jgi:hypothetical protein
MPAADTIFTGGPVVTMNDHAPSAEAVAVKDGRIVAVGGASDVRAAAGAGTRIVDLAGRTLLPGFIDGHSHFINAIRMASWANVSAPPAGKVRNIPELIEVLKAAKAKQQLKPGDWLVGYGYDGTTLEERRELTRDDLDPHFPDTPIMLLHVSLHGAVLNTAGFRKSNYDVFAPTPPGGMTARKPNSNEAAGLVMEHSFLPIYMQMPSPTEAQQLELFAAAQTHYASNGYTTTQDAPMEPATRPIYRKAAEQGRLVMDIVGYINWMEFPELLRTGGEPFKGPYRNRFRIGGLKVVSDGSAQGKTAFFTRPLLTPGPGGEKEWRGEPNVTPEELNALVKLAYDNDIHVMIHCNGDAAIDMALDAHEAAGAPSNRRTTIIHSQFVRPDQLELYVRYGMTPSFFTNHTFFWGEVHIENLGKERASFLSPTRAAIDRGLRFTNHSDFAVTPLDPLFILWTSVNRTSRTGQIIGPDQRLTPWEGLKALTLDAAHQYGEEATKGSLEVGKLADFVVLDRNPITVPPETIKDIKVTETFKEGRPIYTA